MTEPYINIHLRLLIVIMDHKRASKAEEILSQLGIFMHYCLLGRGTAGHDIIDYLGLDGTEKIIFTCITSDINANKIIYSLNHSLQLHKPGHGIAFTIPINGSTDKIFKMASKEIGQRQEQLNPQSAMMHNQSINQKSEGEKDMSDVNMNELILVIANQGFGEEIMHTAREKGAMGGTIITARQPELQKAMTFWGVSVQEKKEIIAMIVPKNNKESIMQHLVDRHGITKEAHTVVLSIPVDNVLGIS
ncbi:MAG: hypothetical protein HFE77_02925 [Clostridiales bacterium]|nr:hypothetical protein [Clostridiales bacterium]